MAALCAAPRAERSPTSACPHAAWAVRQLVPVYLLLPAVHLVGGAPRGRLSAAVRRPQPLSTFPGAGHRPPVDRRMRDVTWPCRSRPPPVPSVEAATAAPPPSSSCLPLLQLQLARATRALHASFLPPPGQQPPLGGNPPWRARAQFQQPRHLLAAAVHLAAEGCRRRRHAPGPKDVAPPPDGGLRAATPLPLAAPDNRHAAPAARPTAAPRRRPAASARGNRWRRRTEATTQCRACLHVLPPPSSSINRNYGEMDPCSL
ncbi:uncharacterized protein LOC126235524 [Schistocerca nitens]|uniref:uncharacterized protein LOC126235524 n=1 Tax=Schistocerca nitens TaxID=7011 RepID=UPI00211892EF|nr:uncharacterized protein LOC126235524 [Schistocerca nitens]